MQVIWAFAALVTFQNVRLAGLNENVLFMLHFRMCNWLGWMSIFSLCYILESVTGWAEWECSRLVTFQNLQLARLNDNVLFLLYFRICDWPGWTFFLRKTPPSMSPSKTRWTLLLSFWLARTIIQGYVMESVSCSESTHSDSTHSTHSDSTHCLHPHG